MDLAASNLGTKIRNFVHSYPYLMAAAMTMIGVLFVLLVAQVFFGMPKEMFVLLSGTFILWSAVYWLLNRKNRLTTLKHLTRWLVPWILILLIFLGALYAIDRGGWLWFRVTGYDVMPAEDLSAEVAIAPAEFVAAHPEFELDENGLHLPAGEHVFKETIIIPQGTTLTIDPGAILRFGAARSLVSYSPVIAQGSEDRPILFTAQNPWLKWGVFGIVGSSPSTFEHIRVEHGRQALINDVEFFAGLSLIEADGIIRNSSFDNAFGKDAVNVRSSDVLIEDNVFRNAYKDCLDLDGGSGEIRGNLFVDCLDEGIDLSQNNNIEAYDNTILDDRGGRLGAEINQEQIIEQNTLGYSDQGK